MASLQRRTLILCSNFHTSSQEPPFRRQDVQDGMQGQIKTQELGKLSVCAGVCFTACWVKPGLTEGCVFRHLTSTGTLWPDTKLCPFGVDRIDIMFTPVPTFWTLSRDILPRNGRFTVSEYVCLESLSIRSLLGPGLIAIIIAASNARVVRLSFLLAISLQNISLFLEGPHALSLSPDDLQSNLFPRLSQGL